MKDPIIIITSNMDQLPPIMLNKADAVIVADGVGNYRITKRRGGSIFEEAQIDDLPGLIARIMAGDDLANPTGDDLANPTVVDWIDHTVKHPRQPLHPTSAIHGFDDGRAWHLNSFAISGGVITVEIRHVKTDLSEVGQPDEAAKITYGLRNRTWRIERLERAWRSLDLPL